MAGGFYLAKIAIQFKIHKYIPHHIFMVPSDITPPEHSKNSGHFKSFRQCCFFAISLDSSFGDKIPVLNYFKVDSTLPKLAINSSFIYHITLHATRGKPENILLYI
jgi:hypothetical protein